MAMMNGGQAITAIMRSEGLEYVFGNPGSTAISLHDAIKANPEIKYIMGLHESIAVGMADGYSRASGKTGVVNVHAIEGVLNSMSIIYNSYHGGGKVALIVGRADTKAIGREGLWHDDMVPVTQNHTKWSYDVRESTSIPMILRRLFKVVGEPPAGPGLVSIPMDIMDSTVDMTIPPVSEVYNHVYPDPVAIEKASLLLVGAKNPVIYLGDRVAQSKAVPEVVKLAEILGARVYTTAMTELNFPMDHPLWMGNNQFGSGQSVKLLEDVDVVLAVGSDLGKLVFGPDNPAYLPDVKLIQMDCSTWEIGKNYPLEIGIVSDCKVGLKTLTAAVNKHMNQQSIENANRRAGEIRRITDQRKATAEKNAEASWNNFPLSLPRLMTEVKNGIEPGTAIVTEAISTLGALYQFLAPSEPGTLYYTPGGSLGWGMPATLGVKLGSPERPVVGLIGDGSSMYSIQALWTAAHYNIPVTFVILNNYRYDMLRLVWKYERGKEARHEDVSYYVDLDKPCIDFVKMAEAHGVRGTRISRPEELSRAIKESIKAGKPSLIEVPVETASW